ncbi:MAG: hypothetical protein JSR79_13875 [Proteobacteria bacterium]|nr:hypothetical protein [Pseudomonadota bacterium]
MTPAQRREARIGFAMLPLGLLLVLAAVIGGIAALALGLVETIRQDDDWGWYVGWALLAAALGARNLIKSLQNMSALDFRGTFVTIGLSAVIVATYPGWWLT